ncbi:MAG: ATP-binding cassette domain-containing protein [Chloroflexota bacterium]|nr:ATP-binding cassette domain-containing protein [Chloroflexota bacterium]
MTLLIQAATISHAYGGNQIFTDVSFELRRGDRVALIGENGAGKSTLFKIMARQLRPDAGVVTHRRNLTVGYLSQEPTLEAWRSIRETVALAAGDPGALEAELRALEARLVEPLDDAAMADVLDAYSVALTRFETGSGATVEATVAATLSGLGLGQERWDQPIGELSGGEKKLVGLARFLVATPDLLLLDEPDNHLDITAKRWLETYLAAYPGAVGLISHDRTFIDRTMNRIFEIEDGRITGYTGDYSAYLMEKWARLERADRLRDLQEREFKKLKASAEQLTQWARQNPKFASRAENQRRKMAEERERLETTPAPMLNRRRIDPQFSAERGSTLALEATALAKSYADREIVRPFELTIRHGERVGLVGPNGAGKTTLFRLILGREEPSGGALRIGPSTIPGYYAQEQETLDPAATPLSWVRAHSPLNEHQALSFLVSFGFDRTDAFNRIAELSGGERARLQIGTLILTGANFLLLDEPTNNLDIPSVEALEAALLDFTGTILAISHDRYFLDKICDRTLELRDGYLRDFPGGYSAYQDRPKIGALLTIAPMALPRVTGNDQR